MKTLTVQDFVNSLKDTSDLTIRDAAYLSNMIIGFLAGELAKGNSVKLRGLGTFDIKTMKAKKIIHPATGGEIVLAKRKAVVFRAAKSLKESVQKLKCG
ncbi:MAG: hypothetical protein Ta2C_10950 [Candidatus Endomicrobiellum trichonymphae]|uniref:HU family DNA-binding protein n=1 Tax=Endomicrobium trichonymphae TaxID=1408204 RepID=UPI0027D3B238|nr:MAG: hypothetical protein Ta2C_10950 [Candidatus Endomicrobium trichonymphae]